MQSLTATPAQIKRVQSDYGYSLFVASQSISRCTNDDQRVGWKEAERGYHASLLVEAVFAFGGNGSDADAALAKAAI